MRRLIMRFIYCLAALLFAGRVYTAEVVLNESVKEMIAKKQREVEAAADNNRGLHLKELAVLYLHDQDQECAFETFISALAVLQSKVYEPQSKVDSDLGVYEEALTLYLGSQSGSPQEASVQILDKFAAASQEGPLGYLIALSYANLGRYADFFELFFHTYANYPENYLADKTLAILYVKMFERARTNEKREAYRKSISAHLARAEIKEPNDKSLYKLQIAFCSSKEKTEIVSRCLNKIIESNIIIPRSEIQFYVQQAVDTRQKDLAQKFINKARQWHSSSRIIDIAQKFLDDSR